MNITEVMVCPSQYIISGGTKIHICMTSDVALEHLAKVVFVSLPYHKTVAS